MIGNDSGRIGILKNEGVIAVVELALIALHAETLLVVVAATNFTVVSGCRGVAGGILI